MVLDEAHLYSGSLGIEISLLLRRLTGFAPKKPQFILTSATLGEQGKSEEDILRFAKKLTSTEFGINDIIFSKRVPLQSKAEYRLTGKDYIDIFVLCSNCRKINVFIGKRENLTCIYCGQPILTEVEYYIEPINGFKSGETKKSTQLKPKCSYAGEVSYIGGGKTDKKLIIGDIITVETSSNDELLE